MSTAKVFAIIREPLELYDVCVTDDAGNFYESTYETTPAVLIDITAEFPADFIGRTLVSIVETNGQTITPCGYETPVQFVPEPGSTVLLLAGALLLAALKRGKQ